MGGSTASTESSWPRSTPGNNAGRRPSAAGPGRLPCEGERKPANRARPSAGPRASLSRGELAPAEPATGELAPVGLPAAAADAEPAPAGPAPVGSPSAAAAVARIGVTRLARHGAAGRADRHVVKRR